MYASLMARYMVMFLDQGFQSPQEVPVLASAGSTTTLYSACRQPRDQTNYRSQSCGKATHPTVRSLRPSHLVAIGRPRQY
jgi:hypothetical protein